MAVQNKCPRELRERAVRTAAEIDGPGAARVFPLLLTDRGHAFGAPQMIERGGHTLLCCCDGGRTDQKGGTENCHRLIRHIVPKGTSIDDLSRQDAALIAHHVGSQGDTHEALALPLADVCQGLVLSRPHEHQGSHKSSSLRHDIHQGRSHEPHCHQRFLALRAAEKHRCRPGMRTESWTASTVANTRALSTAALLLVGMYVPGIASQIDLTPVPIGLLLLTAVVVVAWMLLLEVRKYVRRARKSPEPVAA